MPVPAGAKHSAEGSGCKRRMDGQGRPKRGPARARSDGRRRNGGDDDGEADSEDAPPLAAAPGACRCRAPERYRRDDGDVASEMTKMVPPGLRNQQQRGSIVVVPHHGGRQLSWFSQGGLASRQMPQGLSVRVRLLLIGPGAGMRVARASLPRFGALQIDNTPTPACLSICGIYIVQSAPGVVSR